LLAGLLLAEAAIHDGKQVVQTQSYAPFARGGPSSSEVIIGDEEIDYPRVTKPHLIVALSQGAYDAYAPSIRRNGILIVDSSAVQTFEVESSHHRTFPVPITDVAVESTGRELTASMVSLGIIAEVSGIVTRNAVLRAVANRSPKGSADVNALAVEAGFAEGAKLKESGELSHE